MQDFERTASEPGRLFGSSFRLLQEEKFRKAAYPTLLRLEAALDAELERFRADFGEDVLADDGRCLRDALAAEKENRHLSDTVFCFAAPPR